MPWDVETTRGRDGSPDVPRAGCGWLPARAERPIFLLLGALLLALGLSELPTSDAAPGLVTHPPAIRVDLNRDPPERLTLIPGIGPQRARAIVEFRDTHGPFARSRDLLRVPGVGPSLMRRLAPLLHASVPASAAADAMTGEPRVP